MKPARALFRYSLVAMLAVAALWPLAAQGLVRAGADPNAILCGHPDWSQFTAEAQADIRLLQTLANQTDRKRDEGSKPNAICIGCLVAQTALAPGVVAFGLPVCLTQMPAELGYVDQPAPPLDWAWDRSPRAPPHLA